MQFHPFAEVFPLLQDGELADLADDIKAFGLREPIWLYEGKILDGRNRWLACQKARKEPQYRTFKGTEKGALALVVSANMHRRQLTLEQRAMAAAKIASLRAGSNQHLPKNAGEDGMVAARAATSQADAAKAFDVSPDSVQRARKVIEKGSKELQQAVESGEVSLKRAAAATDKPKREQLAAAKKKKKPANDGPAPRNEPPADLSEFLTPEEIARQEADEKRYIESLERAAGDSAGEIKRLNDLLTAAYQARDRFMNESAAKEKRIRALERENEKLKGQLGIGEKRKTNGEQARA